MFLFSYRSSVQILRTNHTPPWRRKYRAEYFKNTRELTEYVSGELDTGTNGYTVMNSVYWSRFAAL